MKLVRLLVASFAAGLLGASAHADSFVVPLTGAGDNKSASISRVLTTPGAFSDTYTFTGLSEFYSVNSVLSTIIGAARHDIDFTSVTLNGVSYSLSQSFFASNPDGRETASFASMSLSGPLTLTVNGVFTAASGGGSPVGTYSGTLNVTAVPEPQSYALFGAGLLLLGWLSWRRSAQA
jgi:hypothetical protein